MHARGRTRLTARLVTSAVIMMAGALASIFTPARALAAGARPACDPAAVERDVRYLASDDREGRGLGTAGLEQALAFVAQRFREIGLQPAFPANVHPERPLAGYFQEFTAEGRPTSANVIGILPGDSSLAPRAVILGAHADHLGKDLTLEGDRVYNGADDNASGVAALLAIAHMLAQRPSSTAERMVVFAVFSGEESGLLGSRYYADHPIVPAADVIAMINLDSVGRMEGNRVIVFGTGTAREFPAILGGINQAFGLDLAQRSEGAGASDQVSFFAQSIPVLHFFTGPHSDYSRVTDEADHLNYAGLAALTDFAGELVRYLRYRERALTFVPAGADQAKAIQRMAATGERKVSLGFMPDFAQGTGGVKIGLVTPGGAAAAAGLLKGDIVTAIDDQPTDTLTDYTAVLREHAPGDRITLTVRRGAETLRVPVVVQERK